MKKDTSWEKVAGWYNNLLAGEGTYQKELILPNLLRLMAIRKGDAVLDLACGQGFFSREFHALGAKVTGVDASRALIGIARKNSPSEIYLRVAQADSLAFVKEGSIHKIAIVLALQNMENVAGVLKSCARVLKDVGTISIVLNHPAFRIPGTYLDSSPHESRGRFRLQTANPSSKDLGYSVVEVRGFRSKTPHDLRASAVEIGSKASRWGWDERERVQYRRVDRYLSEAKIEIDMHPGKKASERTISFHRPLQFYVKALSKVGFCVAALEEWNSHKKSEPGPRAEAEDRARKEIPLFLCLVGKKIH